MRPILTSSISILALAIAGSVTMYAQAPQDQSQTTPPHRPFHRRGPNPDFETKMLTKRLSLSPQQASQVEPILAEREERMKALKPASGSQPDFKAMHEQRKSIMDDTQQKLEAVLTPEQQQQLKQMHQHPPQFHGPRGNGAPRPGTAPGV